MRRSAGGPISGLEKRLFEIALSIPRHPSVSGDRGGGGGGRGRESPRRALARFFPRAPAGDIGAEGGTLEEAGGGWKGAEEGRREAGRPRQEEEEEEEGGGEDEVVSVRPRFILFDSWTRSDFGGIWTGMNACLPSCFVRSRFGF